MNVYFHIYFKAMYKYIIAACVGATVVPFVAFLGDRIDYVGGAIAAIPLVDILPLLFIDSRSSARTLMTGDFLGQCGALTGIFLAFLLLHYSDISTSIIAILSIACAVVLNAAAYGVLSLSI